MSNPATADDAADVARAHLRSTSFVADSVPLWALRATPHRDGWVVDLPGLGAKSPRIIVRGDAAALVGRDGVDAEYDLLVAATPIEEMTR